MSATRRYDNRRPKWHEGDGTVNVQAETNDKGQTVLVIPRYHRKEVGGNSSDAWSPQHPYTMQHNRRMRKCIKTLLHTIVVHNMIDLDAIDPYVEDVNGRSEVDYRGT